MTYLIYLAVLSTGFSGVLLLQAEKYQKAVKRAKRWRIQAVRNLPSGISPLPQLKLFLKKIKKARMESELYETVAFLRNAILLGNGRVKGADSLIEELSTRRGYLAAVFGKVLRLIRQNQKEEALRCFTEELGETQGSDFGRLLLAWDEMDPSLLEESLFSYQKCIREVRLTARKKKDEVISDLIYLPVVLNVMLVFLNFIYVGYFIDQKEMLTMLL